MDQKSEVMIALGTAIGVNCIPCFDHLYAKAKEIGLEDMEIKKIAEIAHKVKSGASMFLKKAMEDVVGEVNDAQQPCCSPEKGGCC